MAELEKIRRTIESAEDLQSVVRTMKSMAAVASRQFERAVESLRAYSTTVERALQVLLRAPAFSAASATQFDGGRVGAIVFGSDQGMVGRFNEEIVEFADAHLDELGVGRDDRLVATMGERPVGGLQDAGYSVERVAPVPSTPEAVGETVSDILQTIEEWRAARDVGRVILFSNEPARGAGWEPRARGLVPLEGERLREIRERPWPTKMLPISMMGAGEMLAALLRQYLFVSLFRAAAFSVAAENAARMASMQSAEKNIDERLGELQAKFRHERQRSITEELLDIVSGFEALAGKN